MIRTSLALGMMILLTLPAEARGPEWAPSEAFRTCSAKAMTRVEGDACLSAESQLVRDRLDQYLSAVRDRLTKEAAETGDKETLPAFEKTEAAFEEYRRLECAAVSSFWSGGSARFAESARCGIRLTTARTHEVWQHFLTYVDRTPPLLPEP